MNRIINTIAALCVAGWLLSPATSCAQLFFNRPIVRPYYVPNAAYYPGMSVYAPSYNFSNYYDPSTGQYIQRGSYYDPNSGIYSNQSFYNPYSGSGGVYQQYYNPFTGAYEYRYFRR